MESKMSKAGRGLVRLAVTVFVFMILFQGYCAIMNLVGHPVERLGWRTADVQFLVLVLIFWAANWAGMIIAAKKAD
jgi:hypothetical protein